MLKLSEISTPFENVYGSADFEAHTTNRISTSDYHSNLLSNSHYIERILNHWYNFQKHYFLTALLVCKNSQVQSIVTFIYSSHDHANFAAKWIFFFSHNN